jgi:hypothetical protein
VLAPTKHYADRAISGADSRRAEYLAMQSAAAREEFDILLVDDLSRLARDSVEEEQLIRRLEFQGIRIVAGDYDSTHVRDDPSLRIISDELFDRAQRRARTLKNGDPQLKSGGKPRYLLSGLFRCESCGSNFTMVNKHSYACSSFINGRACSNGTLDRREGQGARDVAQSGGGLPKADPGRPGR